MTNVTAGRPPANAPAYLTSRRALIGAIGMVIPAAAIAMDAMITEQPTAAWDRVVAEYHAARAASDAARAALDANRTPETSNADRRAHYACGEKLDAVIATRAPTAEAIGEKVAIIIAEFINPADTLLADSIVADLRLLSGRV